MIAPVPLVTLTGFLGAGKTTALNRVLHAQDRRRVAVIVNELGRIDIDGRLLRARSGDVIELTGGCVCHEIRTQEELWDGLREIVARSRPDVIVLETTGIAEPGPILQGLDEMPAGDDGEPWVVSAGVVTVVDGEAGLRHLSEFEEARRQVVDADRILISKLDRSPTGDIAAGRPPDAAIETLHDRIALLNPDAERASFPDTDEATALLGEWMLGPRAPRDRRRPSGAAAHSHHHLGPQIVAASFVDDQPLLARPLLALCEKWSAAILRVKGFVNVAGENRRGFLERAGGRTHLRFEAPWAHEPRRTELVLIGQDLDAAAIRRQIWACRAPLPPVASV